MDGLIVWIKKNQLLAGGIILIVVFVGYSEFLSGPQNYEDCVLKIIMNAQTVNAANMGQGICRQKFPKPQVINPLSLLPPGSVPYKP